jgi:hypothetical protein
MLSYRKTTQTNEMDEKPTRSSTHSFKRPLLYGIRPLIHNESDYTDLSRYIRNLFEHPLYYSSRSTFIIHSCSCALQLGFGARKVRWTHQSATAMLLEGSCSPISVIYAAVGIRYRNGPINAPECACNSTRRLVQFYSCPSTLAWGFGAETVQLMHQNATAILFPSMYAAMGIRCRNVQHATAVPLQG